MKKLASNIDELSFYQLKGFKNEILTAEAGNKRPYVMTHFDFFSLDIFKR